MPYIVSEHQQMLDHLDHRFDVITERIRIMSAEITELRTTIVSEVSEAIAAATAAAQAKVDEALAQADSAEEARAAVQQAFDDFRAEVTDLTAEVAAPGFIGQEQAPTEPVEPEQPEQPEQPVDPVEEPAEPEAPAEPVEPEQPADPEQGEAQPSPWQY